MSPRNTEGHLAPGTPAPMDATNGVERELRAMLELLAEEPAPPQLEALARMLADRLTDESVERLLRNPKSEAEN